MIPPSRETYSDGVLLLAMRGACFIELKGDSSLISLIVLSEKFDANAVNLGHAVVSRPRVLLNYPMTLTSSGLRRGTLKFSQHRLLLELVQPCPSAPRLLQSLCAMWASTATLLDSGLEPRHTDIASKLTQ